MRILAIETSCDDTSIALVDAVGKATNTTAPVFTVHKNVVSSQTAIHRHWGGVVPNLAKREHIRNLPIIFKKMVTNFSKSKIKNQKSKKRIKDKNEKIDVDVVAVTVGPGLEPALWAGIEFAKKLAAELNVPLVGANHLEGHLYASLLPSARENQKSKIKNQKNGVAFPAIVLLVSGGHTILLHMKDLLHWKLLGETRDDAVGEAFDKVARMLGLPYPGGPEIEKLAHKGNPNAIKFPRPMMRENNYDFSFSGLKTSVLYYLKSLPTTYNLQPTTLKNIAASFQSAAIDVLVTKTIRAVREFGAQSVILCGGVAANTALREALQKAGATAGAQFIAPEMEYNTDNAAMIAAAAYMNTLRQENKKTRKQSNLPMKANGNLGL